jgi:hypothetical protein
MKFTESNMLFDFSAFLSAEAVDTSENKFDGASIVDFIAESESSLLFVEAKNYINTSDHPDVQAAIDKSQAKSFEDIDDTVSFTRRIMKKLEHSLYVRIAAGGFIQKPIVMLMIFNLPAAFKFQQRLKLLNRLKRYIPESARAHSAVLFDMPTIDEIKERYGFTVAVQI